MSHGKVTPILESGGQEWGNEKPSRQEQRGNKGRAASALRFLKGQVSWGHLVWESCVAVL